MVQITIIGLGTIGASLGMALEKAMTAEKGHREEILLCGYDRNPRIVEEALVKGAINRIARNLKEAVEEADLVLLAEPVSAIGETIHAIAPLLPADCVVTDTASSKTQVLRWAERYLPATVHFVGGHPIPLPQQEVDWSAGVKAARADLLEGGIYCLAPTVSASSEAVDLVRNLARMVGASPFFVDPLEHDGLLAGLSHAPYVLAAAMLYTISVSQAWRDLKLLADPTFRYLNQVLASQPNDFYQDCLSNRETLTSWLDRVISVLVEVRHRMADRDDSGEYLHGIAEKAYSAYEDWLHRRDERRKEMEATGMEHVPSAKDSFLGLILPGAARRRERRKGS